MIRKLIDLHSKTIQYFAEGVPENETHKVGVLLICTYMWLLQSSYCYYVGISFEFKMCATVGFIEFLYLIILKHRPKLKELIYNLSCFTSIMGILAGNLDASVRINATFIFFAVPPILCIPMVGILKGFLWSLFSIIVSSSLMYYSQFNLFGPGLRTAQQEFDIGLQNLNFAPFIVFGIFSYYYNQKNEKEEKLIQSYKNLEIEKKEKEKLLIILFHDLGRNTSLLSGYLELSGTKSLSLESKEKVFQLSEEIKSILQNAKSLDSHNLETNVSKVELKEIYEILKSNFEVKLLESQVNLKLEGNKNIYFYGNRSHLINHIFSNIIDNSIKFSHKNTTIRISGMKEDNKHVIKIEDNGIGFIDEKVKQGPQGQLGSGSGLKIIRQFCELNSITFNISRNSKSKLTEARLEQVI